MYHSHRSAMVVNDKRKVCCTSCPTVPPILPIPEGPPYGPPGVEETFTLPLDADPFRPPLSTSFSAVPADVSPRARFEIAANFRDVPVPAVLGRRLIELLEEPC